MSTNRHMEVMPNENKNVNSENVSVLTNKDDTSPPKRHMEGDDVTQTPSKRSKISKEKESTSLNVSKPSSSKIEIQNDLLLAFSKTGKCVGIKLDYGKPASFADDAERKSWQKEMQKECRILKNKIELGLVKAERLKDRVVLDPQHSPIHKKETDRFFVGMNEETFSLFMEKKLTRLAHELRDSLGLIHPDVERCLQIFDECKYLEINAMMLKTNPECVNTIRQIRRYVGNLKEWKLTPEEEDIFKSKAEIIRGRAKDIYQNFKKLFVLKKDKPFWEEFCDIVVEFRAKTKSIPAENQQEQATGIVETVDE